MDFQYTVNQSEDITVVTLSGRLLGKDQAEDLTTQLEECVTGGQRHFVADMTGLQHMNSTGLNVLISYLTKSRNAGGDFIITNVPDSINKLLIITKLNNVFQVEESVENAIAVLKQSVQN